MSLKAGQRIGAYEVVSAIGAGGMGEVYRARDGRLDRDVAIKLLPEAFAHDPERLARFEREAKTLAALNHPNIAAIYGIEDARVDADVASGSPRPARALILELVDGPTLADRTAEGPLPLDEALPVARQIAEALEAAHEKGVIHRDLKPANIKLRPDGTVKVLDFGLAKLAQAGGSQGAELTASPTITTPAMTGVGVILGTAAYMAPEQARGRAVDRRADVWAFGCVLYEMLTGRRVFGGEDVTDTIAAVVRAEPDWSGLPPETPASIRRLLRRCLRKEVRERLPEIGTVRLEIADALAESTDASVRVTAAPGAASRARRRERLAWAAAVVLLAFAALALSVLYWQQSRAVPEPEMRAEISAPSTNDPASFALSPDGRHLVFSAVGEDNQSRLWLRSLNAVGARPLMDTEGAYYPFWSPDSRSIAFFGDRELRRMDVTGATPLTITDAPGGRGGTWNRDGTIVFALFNQKGNGLLRVQASGGDPVPVTQPRGAETHRFPQFLPDGRRFVFFARDLQGPDGTRRQGIYLGSLDSEEIHHLTSADTAGLYVQPGWLLFVRDTVLLGQRLDLARRQLTGDPVTVAQNVYYEGTTQNIGAFSISTAGTMAYRTGDSSRRQLRWFDRAGRPGETVGGADAVNFASVDVSPDGRRVAAHRNVDENSDVWILDGTRTIRFTFDENVDEFPVWSPDGRQIVIDSTRSGTRDLYQKPSAGGGREELIADTPRSNKTPYDFSPDGRWLMFGSEDAKTGSDIWILPLEGNRQPFAFVNTSFTERGGQFSPDGRWIAYSSNESGRHEVYVRPFRGPSGQWQISTAGGAQARWARNGKELYYLAPDGTLMGVPMTVKNEAIEPGTPIALFQSGVWNANASLGNQYDVGPDDSFLVNVATDRNSVSPITLLLNWTPERPN